MSDKKKQPISKKHDRFNGKALTVVLLVITGLLIVILVTTLDVRLNDKYPLRNVLVDNSVLGKSEILYQKADASFFEVMPSPGNDSVVHVIYKLEPSVTTKLVHNGIVLKQCVKQESACSSPIWKPRSELVKKDRLQGQKLDLKGSGAELIYDDLEYDSDTKCTAYNRSHDGPGAITYNIDLVCINPTTNTLVYEYVSNNDSIPY